MNTVDGLHEADTDSDGHISKIELELHLDAKRREIEEIIDFEDEEDII